MSALVAILMVKNSRSFELMKIRHFRDQPYRRLFEIAKGSAPALPILREWQDEAIGGALAPASKAPDAEHQPKEPAAPLEIEKRQGAGKPPAGTRTVTRI